MKTNLTASLLRATALTALLACLPGVATATATPAPDRAAQLLAQHGAVAVAAAGPYVERGTPRIQVSTKLGRPDVTLPDGTWLYRNRVVEGSSARGTLIVRFNAGRVHELAIATPAVVAALHDHPRQPAPSMFAAHQ